MIFTARTGPPLPDPSLVLAAILATTVLGFGPGCGKPDPDVSAGGEASDQVSGADSTSESEQASESGGNGVDGGWDDESTPEAGDDLTDDSASQDDGGIDVDTPRFDLEAVPDAPKTGCDTQTEVVLARASTFCSSSTTRLP